MARFPKWKKPIGYGICSVHDKWEEVNHLRMAHTGRVADDYIYLCKNMYEDYVLGEK